jgi:hypothetical protein
MQEQITKFVGVLGIVVQIGITLCGKPRTTYFSRQRAKYLELLVPLSQSIRTHWNYISIDDKLFEYDGEMNNKGKNDRGLYYRY